MATEFNTIQNLWSYWNFSVLSKQWTNLLTGISNPEATRLESQKTQQSRKNTFVFFFILTPPITVSCNSVEYIATKSTQIYSLLVLSMRGQITHISRLLNIPTREERKKGDWLIPKMNVPCSFWANNTKPVKGNIGIIWWGIPNVSGGWIAKG